ncbi:hypothetical protein [Brachybacterium sp. FME24]|uniref:hypothetical protein n=1 Tax=Brachybacterium sp. FME24 TaxID=2742605 RepID=UPI00186744AF|nr:hypothetical protein [Brachybacterium sp. FME24]
MPRKIDPQRRGRCMRDAPEHQQEDLALTAGATAVARWEDVSRESVRRGLAPAIRADGAP